MCLGRAVGLGWGGGGGGGGGGGRGGALYFIQGVYKHVYRV